MPVYGYPRRYQTVGRSAPRAQALAGKGNPSNGAIGRLERDLAGIVAGEPATREKKDLIAGDLLQAAEGGAATNDRGIRSLASDLVEALASRPASGKRSLNVNGLAKALATLVNAPFRPRAESTQAIDRVLSELRSVGIGPDRTRAVSQDLNVLAFDEAPNERPQVRQAAANP